MGENFNINFEIKDFAKMKGEKGLQMKSHRHLEKYSKMNKREFELHCQNEEGIGTWVIHPMWSRYFLSARMRAARCKMYNPVQKISMPKGTGNIAEALVVFN